MIMVQRRVLLLRGTGFEKISQNSCSLQGYKTPQQLDWKSGSVVTCS